MPPAFTRAGLRLLRRAIPPSGIWSVPCSPPERARPYWEASQVEQALSLPSRTTKVRREPMRSPRRAAFQNRPSPSFRSRVGGSPMAASSSNEPPVAGVGVAFAAGAEAAPLSRSRCFALLYTQPACQFRPAHDRPRKHLDRKHLNIFLPWGLLNTWPPEWIRRSHASRGYWIKHWLIIS